LPAGNTTVWRRGGHVRVTRPTRWVRPEVAPVTDSRHPSGSGTAWKCTVDGSRIGERNVTSATYDSGSFGASCARHRAIVHIPWAIRRRKPNARAARSETWIGLRSPETAAYSRPVSRATRHTAVGSGGVPSGSAVRPRRCPPPSVAGAPPPPGAAGGPSPRSAAAGAPSAPAVDAGGPSPAVDA